MCDIVLSLYECLICCNVSGYIYTLYIFHLILIIITKKISIALTSILHRSESLVLTYAGLFVFFCTIAVDHVSDLPHNGDNEAGDPGQSASLVVCGCDHISLTELAFDAYRGFPEMLHYGVRRLGDHNSAGLLPTVWWGIILCYKYTTVTVTYHTENSD